MMLTYLLPNPICEPKKTKFYEKIVRRTLNPTFVPFYMKKNMLSNICNYTKMRVRYAATVSGTQGIHPFTQPIFKIKNN